VLITVAISGSKNEKSLVLDGTINRSIRGRIADPRCPTSGSVETFRNSQTSAETRGSLSTIEGRGRAVNYPRLPRGSGHLSDSYDSAATPDWGHRLLTGTRAARLRRTSASAAVPTRDPGERSDNNQPADRPADPGESKIEFRSRGNGCDHSADDAGNETERQVCVGVLRVPPVSRSRPPTSRRRRTISRRSALSIVKASGFAVHRVPFCRYGDARSVDP
jgi:hypothetical protein